MIRLLRLYRDWLFLLGYFAAIAAILPLSQYILKFVVRQGPFFYRLVSLCVLAAAGGIVTLLVLYVLVTRKPFKLLRLLALTLLVAVGILGLIKIGGAPERMHLIEYSALSLLLFRTLRFYNPSTALYFWCIVFVSATGLLDETVQRFFPARNFSWIDIWADIFAGALTQIAIALVIRPRLEKWRIRMSLYKKKLAEQDKWIYQYREIHGTE